MNYFFYNTDADCISEAPTPRFPVLIKRGFAAVGGDRQKYGEQLNKLKPNDILLMYENGVGVVAVGRVCEKWDGVQHRIPKYYTPAELENFDNSLNPYEYRIQVHWLYDLSDSPIGIQQLRERVGYTPRGAIQPIGKRQKEVSEIIEELKEKADLSLPGEIASSSPYVEGAIRRVSINIYERNHKAVRQCKDALGTICVICGFNFEAVYGEEFRGFIHIHHLKPLSEIREEYEIDPKTDLCPVCPNCHAIIHYGGRLRSIDEVKQCIRRTG